MTTANATEAGAAPAAVQSRREERLLDFIRRRLKDSAVCFEIRLFDGGVRRFGAGESRFRLEIAHPHGLKGPGLPGRGDHRQCLHRWLVRCAGAT